MSFISKIVNLFSPTAQKTAMDGNKMGVTSKAVRDRARRLAAEGTQTVEGPFLSVIDDIIRDFGQGKRFAFIANSTLNHFAHDNKSRGRSFIHKMI